MPPASVPASVADDAGTTVIVTVAAVLERLPSLTIKLKVSAVDVVTVGATKVG
jgi:hypothetical protein